MRILIVTPGDTAGQYLARALLETSRLADVAPDARTAGVMLQDGAYDAVIIERALRPIDGLHAVRQWRAQGMDLPILMLGPPDQVRDQADCLHAGCDDYLAHPYAFVELDLRLGGLIARHQSLATALPATPTAAHPPATTPTTVPAASLLLDPSRRQACVDGRVVALSVRECLLLQRLSRRAGETVNRADLLEATWDLAEDASDHWLERQIHRLRQKLGPGALIETVRGVGYRLARG